MSAVTASTSYVPLTSEYPADDVETEAPATMAITEEGHCLAECGKVILDATKWVALFGGVGIAAAVFFSGPLGIAIGIGAGGVLVAKLATFMVNRQNCCNCLCLPLRKCVLAIDGWVADYIIALACVVATVGLYVIGIPVLLVSSLGLLGGLYLGCIPPKEKEPVLEDYPLGPADTF